MFLDKQYESILVLNLHHKTSSQTIHWVKNNLDTINIVEWEFVGDEETIFEKWDESFGDEDGFVNTDMIDDFLEMINLSKN